MYHGHLRKKRPFNQFLVLDYCYLLGLNRFFTKNGLFDTRFDALSWQRLEGCSKGMQYIVYADRYDRLKKSISSE